MENNLDQKFNALFNDIIQECIQSDKKYKKYKIIKYIINILKLISLTLSSSLSTISLFSNLGLFIIPLLDIIKENTDLDSKLKIEKLKKDLYTEIINNKILLINMSEDEKNKFMIELLSQLKILHTF